MEGNEIAGMGWQATLQAGAEFVGSIVGSMILHTSLEETVKLANNLRKAAQC
jgi:hypothetical protein